MICANSSITQQYFKKAAHRRTGKHNYPSPSHRISGTSAIPGLGVVLVGYSHLWFALLVLQAEATLVEVGVRVLVLVRVLDMSGTQVVVGRPVLIWVVVPVVLSNKMRFPQV